jgi:putative endonuclease
MYYVYVLYSPDADKCYYGCTKDLNRRVSEHQAGQNTSTAQAADWQLVYYEAYKSKQDAKDRERKIKQHGSTKGHLRNRIARSINNIKQGSS